MKSLEKSWILKGTIFIYFLLFDFNSSVLTYFSEDSDDDDSDEDKVSLSQTVYMSWSHRSDQLEHEYAFTAWVLSLVSEIHNDVLERLTGNMRENIEIVIAKLHIPPAQITRLSMKVTL